jgi:hypothetical protein
MSLYIDQKSTEHTSKHNRVYIDTYKGKRALFLENYDYREFVNPNQLNHVIENIVVNKGFLMDKQTSGEIVFTHSRNTPEYKTYYQLWTKTCEVVKVTHQFLHFV